MADYIEREAALKVLCDACGNAACPKGLIPRCSYYEKMQSIPAADVVTAKGLTAEAKDIVRLMPHAVNLLAEKLIGRMEKRILFGEGRDNDEAINRNA